MRFYKFYRFGSKHYHVFLFYFFLFRYFFFINSFGFFIISCIFFNSLNLKFFFSNSTSSSNYINSFFPFKRAWRNW